MDWTVTDEDGNIIGTIPNEVAKEVLIQAIEEHEKRKHGHWTHKGDAIFVGEGQNLNLSIDECSNCKEIITRIMKRKDTDYDFCPHCGAKMGVTE